MPEYLAPGVYVEEIEIGAKPIEGVSTSTVGMVGAAERGRTTGLPVLVTSFADFERKYGGFLGSQFGKDRYLAYAVDDFFRNGGQRVYIMRVLFPGASQAEKTSSAGVITRIAEDTPIVESGVNEEARKKVQLLTLRGIEEGTKLSFVQLNDDGTESSVKDGNMVVKSYNFPKKEVILESHLQNQYLTKNTRVTLEKLPIEPATAPPNSVIFRAKDKGKWGDQIKIEVYPVSKVWSNIIEVVGTVANSKKFKLKSASGFYIGAIVQFDDGKKKQYRRIESIDGDTITIDKKFAANTEVVDATTPPTKKLSTCEFKLLISYAEETQSFDHLTTNPATANYYLKVVQNKSNLIGVMPLYKDTDNPSLPSYARTDPFDQPVGENGLNVLLTGGNDGTPPANASDYIGISGDPGKKSGIKALEDIDGINIIAVPGISDVKVQNEIISQCELLKDRFAILDAEPDADIASVQVHRDQLDSKYAAVYYPWIKITDPLEKIDIFTPPGGSIAGIYARSDTERGVHKAPANERLRGAIDVKVRVGKREQDILNPKGINCIRVFPGRGIRIWGARTISSDALWKYVNVRRLFLFLEESIDEGTQWVVFEPNDEKLWARVRQTITQFLTRVWKDGALMGTTSEEAFFVKCDRTTMTQDDIDNGRLIVLIGVAPVKPAEFVIFRIAQWAGGSAVTE